MTLEEQKLCILTLENALVYSVSLEHDISVAIFKSNMHQMVCGCAI